MNAGRAREAFGSGAFVFRLLAALPTFSRLTAYAFQSRGHMQLSSLVGADILAPLDVAGVEVRGLTSDSRAVGPGFLFAALPGVKVDGVSFVGQAVREGAAAVLVPHDAQIDASGIGVPVLRAQQPRRALARMAARFFERQPETAVAVTGTSGKTSVVEFTRQIFSAVGLRAASIGTIGVVTPEGGEYGSLTTPDPVALHETLRMLADEGITHLAFEASSHGLVQSRLDGVRLAAAAFTNLGRDHLDYHKSVEDYLEAKLRLFRELLRAGQPAVINMDGAYGDVALACAREAGLRCITVGTGGETLRLNGVTVDGFSQRLEILADRQRFDIKLPLVGAYQVENALVAAGLALGVGCDLANVLPALETLSGVKGRLDIIGQARGGLAVVDYAHKPEALSAALSAVRPFVSGRLICVFGCGGDRDRGKRPIMGDIAAKMCDVVIVTDDNPRTEDAAAIRTEILEAAPDAREIGDRAEAISEAVGMMGAGDVVVIAGKGHETGQIVGDQVLPFSDHDVVSSALKTASSGE